MADPNVNEALARLITSFANNVDRLGDGVSRAGDAVATGVGKAVDVASTGAVEAGKFVWGQIPDLIYQLVLYNLILNSVLVGLGTLTLILTVWLNLKYKEHTFLKKDNWGISQPWWIISFLIPMFLGIGLVVMNVSELLKLVFAPKIWLIEYAQHLLIAVKK